MTSKQRGKGENTPNLKINRAYILRAEGTEGAGRGSNTPKNLWMSYVGPPETDCQFAKVTAETSASFRFLPSCTFDACNVVGE